MEEKLTENWKGIWKNCIASIIKGIERDPTGVSWKEIRKKLEDGCNIMLSDRLNLKLDMRTMGIAIKKSKVNQDIYLNCLKNLEESVRYLKYKLADFARHNEAFRAAGYQNFCLTKIARLRKRWLKYFFYQLHRFFSYYNTQPWRFGIWVIGTIILFAFLYHFSGCIIDRDGHKPTDLGQYLYFSTVTIATLGYGDFVPKHDCGIGIFLSGFEGIIGYIFLALLVNMIYRFSEIHPYSPPGWSNYYENKLNDCNFF